MHSGHPEAIKMPKAVRGSDPSNPGLTGYPFKILPMLYVLVGRAHRKTVGFFQVKLSFAIKLNLTFLKHFSH